ncbi:hypothetical protein [Chitinophaga sp. Ak27]|uniref:hypothetical protein n=1 Tax=Chitinophaga sp. Ak27 TaxID=2726116 RepID=UPI00145EB0C0|nr:hypothetical protein [Chitinophaga sp. Ak27]NLU94871.1 hypothetical protein [Chitinophaga sp. Ak27]
MKKFALSGLFVLVTVASGLAHSSDPADWLYCNDGDPAHGCREETPFVTLVDRGLGSKNMRCTVVPTNTLCPLVPVYYSY